MDVKQSLFNRFKSFVKERFDLTSDSATQQEVVNSISNGVVFSGTNLWVLIFATLIASLGLNVNSTAVIIGAMCISPLMGPIIGIGLALGINDYNLMKKSLRNLGFMTIVSICASTLFFIISPISTAQSELLARTMPTLYDVLIALFGGAAGIVAQTRRDRTSTVIPGVAIATALMPPLCTAGFGLATLQLNYFIGALYLYFINMVCIALATYLFIRFLKYPRQDIPEPKTHKRVKFYMSVILAVVIIPSTVIAIHLVRETIFESNVQRYVNTVFNYNNTRVLECNTKFQLSHKYPSTIELVLLGEVIADDVVENARSQMSHYGLEDTELIVHQTNLKGDSSIDFSSVQKSYSELLNERNEQIARLRKRLEIYRSVDTLASASMAQECMAVIPHIEFISMSRHYVYDSVGRGVDTILVCVLKPTIEFDKSQCSRLEKWLQVRGKTDKIMLHYVEE